MFLTFFTVGFDTGICVILNVQRRADDNVDAVVSAESEASKDEVAEVSEQESEEMDAWYEVEDIIDECSVIK